DCKVQPCRTRRGACRRFFRRHRFPAPRPTQSRQEQGMKANCEQARMSPQDSSDAPPWADIMKSFFPKSHQLFAALNMEPSKIAADEVCVIATIPAFFSCEGEGGDAHPGAYTIILDTVFGFAVFAKIQEPRAIATINLKT